MTMEYNIGHTLVSTGDCLMSNGHSLMSIGYYLSNVCMDIVCGGYCMMSSSGGAEVIIGS